MHHSHRVRACDATVSRRGFLAAASAGAGALLTSACGSDATGGTEDEGSRTAGSLSDVASDEGLSLEERVDAVISGLTLEQKVAQLFVVQPESLVENSPVVAAGDATREAVAARPVGGICYFAQNLVDPAQTAEMLANTRSFYEESVGIEPFLAVDEEGGTVSRVASNPAFGVADEGDMRDVGDAQDPERARQACLNIGTYLRDLGFNLDFAPVADIANNPESDTMARRSFGASSDVVAPMVEAAVGGFLDAGVLCCAKHFPGIGGAVGDSHNESITSDKTADEMGAEELVPFERAVAAGVPLVMVGHLSCPGVTGADTPASLSPEVIGGLLRDRLGFEGVVTTDSLGMAAVTSVCEPGEAGVRALGAGVDVILMPENFEAAYQGILDAVADGSIGEGRIDESLRRIVRAKLSMAETQN